MKDVCRVIIFVCLLAAVYAEGYSTEYQTNLNFHKKTCNGEDNVFMLFNVPTILTCSSICASNADCESFFYFPKSLRCDGCKQAYSTDEQLKGSGEKTVYYIKAGHLTTTGTAITRPTTTTTDAEKEYRNTGCFITTCEGDQVCNNYSMNTPIIGINVTSCFDFCDDWEKSRVSTIAIEMEICHCIPQYNQTLTAVCDNQCEGNPEEMCGGNYAMSVYKRNG